MSTTSEGPTAYDAELIVKRKRGLGSFVGCVDWLPRYRWGKDLPVDLVAGLTVAALLIPESIGYANVAGVQPQLGLYAAMAAAIVYALVGNQRVLVVGPSAAVAALSASLIADITGNESADQLAIGLAFAAGIVLLVAGFLRFGWIVNFISRPVLEAFIAGLAISIIVGQMSGLVGSEKGEGSVVRKAWHVLSDVGNWHRETLAIGLGALVILIVLERFLPKLPAAALVVVGGILLTGWLDLGADGVALAGTIPTGLPNVGFPDFSLEVWAELLGGGFALFLVGFSEGFAAAASAAEEMGDVVDPDEELVGAGVANVAAGFFGGMAVSGSLSKTTAGLRAGARSQVAGLTAGVVVVLTLLFLGPVFERLPEPVLAAVVIHAVLRSANPSQALGLWNVNRFDFVAALATFVLALTWETLPAMAVGVFLSLAFLVRRASFPDVVEMEADAHGVVRRVGEADVAIPMDGVGVLRYEAPLLYAGSDRLGQAVDNLIARRGPLHGLVLDAEMMSDLDTSGALALERLDDRLAGQGTTLHLARVHSRAREQIERSRLAPRFEGRTHRTVAEACTAARTA
ncbi:MAG: SulP family inorganic anion transporter [Actinobacteria bacterium]|nr:SulP family inorganic anion transporter [Actinomycetota bacterium]